MRRDLALDFRRIDVFAARLDQLLGRRAALVPEIAVGIERALIAGVMPVVAEGEGIVGVATPVSFEHGWTAHGDFADLAACEAQFRNAFLMGCAGAWTLHPNQVDIAKRVFSPDPGEVAFAKKILAAMPDGSGAVMIDGKMQDDATWKQAKVVVDLARIVASKDSAMAESYGLQE